MEVPHSHRVVPRMGSGRTKANPEDIEGSDECSTVIDNQTVTGTTYTITTFGSGVLVAGTTYDVRVSAGNAVGIGGWSEVVRARVPSTGRIPKSP